MHRHKFPARREFMDARAILRQLSERHSPLCYDSNGNHIGANLTIGASTEYIYNLAGLVIIMTSRHGRQGVNELSRFEYVYYLDGNVSVVTEFMEPGIRTITYIYDTARRLTREQVAGAAGQ